MAAHFLRDANSLVLKGEDDFNMEVQRLRGLASSS